MFKIVFLVLLGLLNYHNGGAEGSPFDLLDNYIDNFQKEMAHLNEYLNYGIFKFTPAESDHPEGKHEELKGNIKCGTSNCTTPFSSYVVHFNN